VYAQEERLPVLRSNTMEKQKQSPRDMSRKGQRSPAGQQAKGAPPMQQGGQMAPPPKGTPPMHTGNK
jgi:hypothetical protein